MLLSMPPRCVSAPPLPHNQGGYRSCPCYPGASLLPTLPHHQSGYLFVHTPLRCVSAPPTPTPPMQVSTPAHNTQVSLCSPTPTLPRCTSAPPMFMSPEWVCSHHTHTTQVGFCSPQTFTSWVGHSHSHAHTTELGFCFQCLYSPSGSLLPNTYIPQMCLCSPHAHTTQVGLCSLLSPHPHHKGRSLLPALSMPTPPR